MVEGAGRRLEVPTHFADDDGTPPVHLRLALERYAVDATARAEVVAALAVSRLLVPVVAVADDDEPGEAHTEEKSSHMATVSLVQADGRRGLLAFTGTHTLALWDPSARPVPAWGVDVAAAAIDEGAQGVLIDIAGPVRFALDGDDLTRLALSARGR